MIMSDNKHNIALKNFRLGKSISKDKIARIIGVSLSFYEKVENGHVNASRGFMEKLKIAYPEVNIDELFFSNMNGRI